MYIKYHPDKVNPTDRNLFEDPFKFMLRQIDRLEEGVPLEEPDNELSPNDNLQFSWQKHYAAWDKNISKPTTSRGRKSFFSS